MILDRLKNNGEAELKLNGLQIEMKAQIDSKVENLHYHFEEIDCPICLSNKRAHLGEKDRYGLYYPTNICKDCGLVYTSPRMTQESYNEFYNMEYRKLYVGTHTANETFFARQQKQGYKILAYLEQHCAIKNKSLSVLEIGCGAGGIVDVFKQNGHQAKGIDLGAEYIEFGKTNHDLDLSVGTLEAISSKDKVDLIIYSHVLEHILDINKEVQLMKQFSHSDTLIYIEVPGIKEIHKNYKSNILSYFQNAHTFHFSLESLKNLMGKNGFELQSGNQFVQALYKISDQSFSIQNDYESVRKYIEKKEKNRIFYPFTKNGMKKTVLNSTLKILDITNTRKLAKSLKKKF